MLFRSSPRARLLAGSLAVCPPARPPAGTVPGPPGPRDLRLPGPRVGIYRCARPALALRKALCKKKKHSITGGGGETWEENKAAGGSRAGRQREAGGPTEEEEEEEGKTERGAGRGSAWRSR